MDKEKGSYKTISEVARIVGLIDKKNGSLSTHTIRFWEKEFNQIKPKIFSGKRRYYDDRSIEIIKNIKYLLKDQGMTIKGVKNLFKNIDPIKLDETTISNVNELNFNKYKVIKTIKNINKIVKQIKKYNG